MPQHNELERLAVLEQRANTLENIVSDLQKRLREIERTVWKATGALIGFQILLGLALKLIHL